MESDAKEPTGVSRGQNAVHVMPWDWPAAEQALTTLVDRVDPARPETQLLVVTADAENAIAAAAAVVRVSGERGVRVVAATASPRAARLLKSAPAHVVTGAPSELAALLQASALKPQSVRGVVLAWLEPILETPDAQPLETLLGELPKEGARVVLATGSTPAIEALIERYARRARRAVQPEQAADVPPLAAEYAATTEASRLVTLRRLLDALDLPRAVLYARSDSARAQAAGIARALGYPPDAVRVADGEDAGPDPLVLVELPSSPDELRALVGTSGRKIYALSLPSQLAGLRSLLGGGALTPIALLDAAERARGKDAALRAALRDVLDSDDVRREVLALEPLLSEFDGIEIAAAALRMLEQQRPARPSAGVAAQTQPMQRLFINLGEKDGIRPQELVTAVTSEAGIPGSQVGKVEVRDTHSLVEVAAAVAAMAAEKLTGSVVRGRRVQARVDAPREARDARPSRGASPARGADRPRSFDRGERADRGPRSGPPRGDRPVRSGPPRGAARGDRPDRPARSFDKPPRNFDRSTADRPTRPRRDDA